MVRLGDGTDESHAKMREAVDAAWPYVGELFSDDGVNDAMVSRQWAPRHADLWAGWLDHVGQALERATLVVPDSARAHHPVYRAGPIRPPSKALGLNLAPITQFQPNHPA